MNAVVQVTFQFRGKVTDGERATADIDRFKQILETAFCLVGDEFDWITAVSSKLEKVE